MNCHFKGFVNLSLYMEKEILHGCINSTKYKISRDHNKKQGSKCVARYPAKKLLVTHSTGSIGYYLRLFMQTQFQMGSNLHPCIHK